MNIDYIRELYDAHYHINNKVWDCVAALTDEQFKQELDYSQGAIYNQMFHLLAAEFFWFSTMKAGKQLPWQELPDREKYPTFEAVRALYGEVETMVRDYLATLTEEDLEKPITYVFQDGVQRETKYWQHIMQMYSHGVDHRAQILAMLHQLGAPTVGQDYIGYVWEKKGY